MINVVVAAAIALLFFAPAPPGPTVVSGPPTGAVTINTVKLAGSGCAAGTVTAAMQPGNGSFTVTYRQYAARTGAGAAGTDALKDCQVILRISAPKGYTYAITDVEYRGYAKLAAGAVGREYGTYFFVGDTSNPYASYSFSGPMDSNWSWSPEAVAAAALVWAPCGVARQLQLNTELRVLAGTQNSPTASLISMDTSAAAPGTAYRLAWKEC